MPALGQDWTCCASPVDLQPWREVEQLESLEVQAAAAAAARFGATGGCDAASSEEEAKGSLASLLERQSSLEKDCDVNESKKGNRVRREAGNH